MINFNPKPIRTPKSIVNYFSAGSVNPIAVDNAVLGGCAKLVLSGALTATTYKEILAVTGPGVLQLAFVYDVDATDRTMGIKVVIDGTTVFDAVSSSLANDYCGVIAVGQAVPLTTEVLPSPVQFMSSLSILIKSSISETDKIGLAYNYYTV